MKKGKKCFLAWARELTMTDLTGNLSSVFIAGSFLLDCMKLKSLTILF